MSLIGIAGLHGKLGDGAQWVGVGEREEALEALDPYERRRTVPDSALEAPPQLALAETHETAHLAERTAAHQRESCLTDQRVAGRGKALGHTPDEGGQRAVGRGCCRHDGLQTTAALTP